MTIINVEEVSKKYLITHERRHSYTALRDVLAEKAKRTARRIMHPFPGAISDPSREEFWALRDVSFEVKVGDRVGIIGRNGAGKSTLLKILSRITEPTKGRISISGRVASLLEVGTGFHPELTGRENIYLNGAILGMSKAEIRRKFDEIVAFAEVERFLDTPVKRYSSGMYVRLAFAVAAHLEPEILVVDEVLAVGDSQFQDKCFGKMQEIGEGGRTVLFVSHSMPAIRKLCTRAILLKTGSVALDDIPEKVTEIYIREASNGEDGSKIADVIASLPFDPAWKLEGIHLSQNGQAVFGTVENGKPLSIEIRYCVLQRTSGLRVFFDLCDDNDIILFRSFHDENNNQIPTMEPGRYTSRVVLPEGLLAPLRYTLRIKSGIHNIRYILPEQGIRIPIKVEQTSSYNRAYAGAPFHGRLAPVLEWETERKEHLCS